MAALNFQIHQDDSNQIENKFLVPYEVNPLFIGRTQFVQMLKEKLSDITPRHYNHRVALYGMGGIGKTQCALRYVYANRDVYDRIYWITAVDQTSLLSGYQSIAEAARLRYLQNTSPIEIANAVLSWLRHQKSWLLVIDNLDDIKIVDRLLPENGSQKHTIITTRNPNARGIPAGSLEVPLLDAEDCIDLLSTLSEMVAQSDSAQQCQAVEIVQMMGYLPLAIEQAAAYVREVTKDFSAFLKEYQRNHKRLHTWVPAGNRQYPNSIATTWSMSFHLLPKYPSKLLRLFSFLNPDGILISFLVSGAEALENDLRHVICDQLEMATALLELEKFSLLKWDRQNKSIAIHRLVQMVVRDEMSDEESWSTRTNIIDLFVQAFPEFTSPQTRSLCRKYQGQIIEPLTRMKNICTSKSAVIRTRVGEFLRDEGKYDDSEKLLLQAVEFYTFDSGTEHPDTLTAMDNLALTYQHQGRNAEATRIQEEVLKKRRRILREDHVDTLMIMHYLASTYHQQGKNAEAARIQEEVLEKRKRILGEEHPDTLTIMHFLALTYQAQGRNTEATRIEEEVLEKRRRILGEEHPDTLMTMHNLASTYQAQGRNAEAGRIQKEVLGKYGKILGENHPSTLMAMNNLALTYKEQGRTEEAAKIQEEALEKGRRVLGEKHPIALTVTNNLALIYQAQGRNADAATIVEEVLESRRRTMGEEHPDTLRATHNLASIYQAQGRNGEAARIQEEVLKTGRRVLGEEHPDTLMIMHNLASTYQSQGRRRLGSRRKC